MIRVRSASLTLAEFLALPETKPASEFVAGQIWQKIMPQGKHSRLQLKLCNAINDEIEPLQLGMAFPELRCTFDNRSIVPDVAVFRWERIPFDTDREIANAFMTYPDWTIEILSPEQNPTKTIAKILHCLECGTQLGWLIDPAERAILAFFADRQPAEITSDRLLPTPNFIELDLTADRLFSWLKVGN